jgi:hypothetical protein
MTTTKLGQQHIYGTHEARIFALDDGTLRVSLFDGERRLKSWPIERTDEAVRKIAKHLGNIREALIAKHGPDTAGAPRVVEGKKVAAGLSFDEAVETYSSGKCMWLAMALHDRYGWRLCAQWESDSTETGGYIAHAFVRLSDGTEVDVLGPQKTVDRFSSDVRCLSRQEFVSLLARSNAVTEEEIEAEYRAERYAADDVIDAYVVPRMIAAGMMEYGKAK